MIIRLERETNRMRKKCIVLLILIAIVMIFKELTREYYILLPNSEKDIVIKGNSISLDSYTDIKLTRLSKDGKIKLSYGRSWSDYDNSIHYNIEKSQVEHWKYNSETETTKIVVLENPHNGIGVDHEGIIIDTSQAFLFTFNSKIDFNIRVKNLSNKFIVFKMEVDYK